LIIDALEDDLVKKFENQKKEGKVGYDRVRINNKWWK
jgi:hypothetical protein